MAKKYKWRHLQAECLRCGLTSEHTPHIRITAEHAHGVRLPVSFEEQKYLKRVPEMMEALKLARAWMERNVENHRLPNGCVDDEYFKVMASIAKGEGKH